MKSGDRVLLTGITGIYGSSLAAKLINDGFFVVGLSRGDGFSERSFRAVEEAYRNISIIDQNIAFDSERLDILEIDFDQIELSLTKLEDYLRKNDIRVGSFIHLAAALDYGPKKALSSYRTNVESTLKIIEFCDKQKSILSESFVFLYASTVYSKGLTSEVVKEELNYLATLMPNVYFMTKNMAEHMLAGATNKYRIPCIIVRPSGIIADSHSGWFGNHKVGVSYLFDFLLLLNNFGINEFRMPSSVCPDGIINLIPLDIVVKRTLALLVAAKTKKIQDVEKSYYSIFNLASHYDKGFDISVFKAIVEAAKGFDISVLKSDEKRLIEVVLEKNLKNVRLFWDQCWNFETDRIIDFVNDDYDQDSDRVLASLHHMGIWYKKNRKLTTKSLKEKLLIRLLGFFAEKHASSYVAKRLIKMME